MKLVNPYLNFPGTAEEAFNFYKSVFGGEFITVMRFKDNPQGSPSPETADKIMHMAMPLGGSILMATDAMECAGAELTVGNNYFISVNGESLAEAQEIYEKLSEGGKIMVPFEKMFWGDWLGQFTDKFGIQWMVNFREERKG